MATIDELAMLVKEFCDERDWEQFHNPKDLAIGISTEANELLQLFRFKSTEESIKKIIDNKMEVEDEVADIFYFILRFAQLYNIDLEAALKSKIKKNKEKYPAEIFKGINKKYDE